MDIAASIQAVTEDIILRMGRHLYEQTRARNLVLAGGVALNCVANGKLLREGPFDSVWIQPAAGDAGGALGAALFTWYQLLDNPRRPAKSDAQKADAATLGSDVVQSRGQVAALAAQGRVYQPAGAALLGLGLAVIASALLWLILGATP